MRRSPSTSPLRIERRALSRLGIEVPALSEDARKEIERLADLEGVREILRAELEQLSGAQRAAIKLRVVDEPMRAFIR